MSSKTSTSVEELIESHIARLTNQTLATETDLRKRAANIVDRNFQFFPAWPDPLDYKRWMAMISYRDKTGVNYLTPSSIVDVITVPKGLFLGLDVNDGWNPRNIAPFTNRANIQAEGRISFTARMGVSYGGDHPVAIDGHGMDLVGSDFGTDDLPSLYEIGSEPALDCHWYGSPDPKCGAPSCGSVVGLQN